MAVRAVRLRTGRQFSRDVVGLIWEYKAYSVAIVMVTVLQEAAALWPVALMGEFVDRLGAGEVGGIVWLFMAASVLYPAILRANVVLRHKMFYETDFEKRIELTLKLRARGTLADLEKAGEANTRIANAVSGITNATYHVLGSFTPVLIKIVIVSGSLIAYNGMLGTAYLASLVVPVLMTLGFNEMPLKYAMGCRSSARTAPEK